MVARLRNPLILLAAVLWIGLMGLVAAQTVAANRSGTVGIIERSGPVRVDRNGRLRDAQEFQAVRRGEIVRTGAEARAVIQLGFSNQVFLDENTDIRLDRLTENDYRVSLIRGRIVVDTHQADAHNAGAFGTVSVSTNGTESGIRYGRFSVVNYDFKETVSVIPIDKTVVGVVTNGGGTVTTTPVDIHETAPVTITDATFDPETSSAKDFYAWALSR